MITHVQLSFQMIIVISDQAGSGFHRVHLGDFQRTLAGGKTKQRRHKGCQIKA
jgi:hypothetical protein